MRILRRPMIPRGHAKWLLFVPLGVLTIIGFMTLFSLFPFRSATQVYRNWPLLVAGLLIYAWVRAFDTGQLPWVKPDGRPLAAGHAGRWDTSRSSRNVHLFGAGLTVFFAAIIYLKLPEVMARDISADLFFIRVGLATLLLLFVGLVIAAFRPANLMMLNDRTLSLAGKDELEIPLFNIAEIVLRPKTDPFVAILRLNDPPKDVALELGRLSLAPAVFAAELTRRRPDIVVSDSRPGVFSSSSMLSGQTDGPPTGDLR